MLKMKKLCVLGLCLMLGGCFGGRSQPAQFYTLAAEPMVEIAQKAVSVGINRVQVARYLDRPQIVTQQVDTTEMKLSEDNRWIEPLTDMVGRILAQDLMSALPKATVRPNTVGPERFAYRIDVDVVRMDGILGQTATMEVFWTIQNADRKVVAYDRMKAEKTVGKSYDDMVKAQSQMLAQVAGQIAEKIAKFQK